MKSLREALEEAEAKKIAIGHFNISEFAELKAIVAAIRELNVPVIIGASEGEGKFMGVRQIAALVKSFKEEAPQSIFLNADHTHSLETATEAARAGFDAILFDGGKLPLEENIIKTKEVVKAVKTINPDILVEGELGYIGTSSEIRKDIPEGAAIKEEDLTKPEDAKRFVAETGVDLIGPAVGNIHGMFANAPDPNLNIRRIREIAETVNVPIVLHGGSGNTDNDFIEAIKAGIRIIHINTEIRVAWRKSLEESLKDNPDEVAPYKLLSGVERGVYDVVLRRLKLFNGLVNI